MKNPGILIAVFCLLAVAACTPTLATRGNMISPANFHLVQTTTSTRADVMKNWGPPTALSPFDANIWYYIGEIDSQRGIFAPQVDKRRMIRVRFDSKNNDTVIAVDDIDPKLAKDIPIVSRTTPAAGKEYTLMQQFIGNIGKYNPSAEKK